MQWFPDWTGGICAVIASGAAANESDAAALKGRGRILVINNSFRLAPWADALYAADGRWWELYPDARRFEGIKITSDSVAAKRRKLHCVEVEQTHAILVEPSGRIGHGGHGGFQGLNLAIQFGARRIALLGFDLCGQHWHEKHPEPLRNPDDSSLEKWRKCLDGQAPRLAVMGIEVINCSPTSALTAFRRMNIRDALAHWA